MVVAPLHDGFVYLCFISLMLTESPAVFHVNIYLKVIIRANLGDAGKMQGNAAFVCPGKGNPYGIP